MLWCEAPIFHAIIFLVEDRYMKLKTRLVIAFFTIIIIPVLMAAMMVSMVCRYQIGVVEKNYGITGTTISDFTNSMQVLARVTEKPYHELKDMSEQAYPLFLCPVQHSFRRCNAMG